MTTKSQFLSSPRRRKLPPREQERRWQQHVKTHQSKNKSKQNKNKNLNKKQKPKIQNQAPKRVVQNTVNAMRRIMNKKKKPAANKVIAKVGVDPCRISASSLSVTVCRRAQLDGFEPKWFNFAANNVAGSGLVGAHLMGKCMNAMGKNSEFYLITIKLDANAVSTVSGQVQFATVDTPNLLGGASGRLAPYQPMFGLIRRVASRLCWVPQQTSSSPGKIYAYCDYTSAAVPSTQTSATLTQKDGFRDWDMTKYGFIQCNRQDGGDLRWQNFTTSYLIQTTGWRDDSKVHAFLFSLEGAAASSSITGWRYYQVLVEMTERIL